MRKTKLSTITTGLAVAMMALVGCDNDREVETVEPEISAVERDVGVVEREPAGITQARVESPVERTTATGDVKSIGETAELGALEITRDLPEEIYTNQPFEYTLVVTNSSEMMLHDIQLREVYGQNLRPAGLQQGQSSPSQMQQGQRGQQQGQSRNQQGQQQMTMGSQQQGQQMQQGQPQMQGQQGKQEQVHRIAMLEPGQSQRIQAAAIPTAEGQLELCVIADYGMAQCATINVVKPELELQRMIVDAEGNPVDRAYACDELFVVYRVTNAGTGDTSQIVITEPLAQGFQTEEGQSQIQIELPGLGAGESEVTEPVALITDQAGMLSGTAVARTGRLQARAGGDTPVQIMKPSIDLQIDGPAQQFLGRTVSYNVTVQNTSQYPAPNTRVALDLPENIDRISISSQRITREGNVFDIGMLAAGSSRSFSIEFEPNDVGQFNIQAVAEAYCAAAAQGQVQTVVQGVPALQIEAVDSQDPLEVGQETTYEIVVINEGSARDTNIRLQGKLGPGLEFVAGEGETQVRGQQGEISFAPIQNLDPGAEAVWLVTVRATSETRSRLTLELQSNAVRRPVREVEPTNIY